MDLCAHPTLYPVLVHLVAHSATAGASLHARASIPRTASCTACLATFHTACSLGTWSVAVQCPLRTSRAPHCWSCSSVCTARECPHFLCVMLPCVPACGHGKRPAQMRAFDRGLGFVGISCKGFVRPPQATMMPLIARHVMDQCLLV